MDLRILHITDFHIDNILSEKENLRKLFFREFINKLCKRVGETFTKPIDYVVATGDFVNFGKRDNFPHANAILNHLCKQLGVPLVKVGTCIGNHDINLQNDFDNEQKKSRKEYNKFASQYSFGTLIAENERAKLYVSEENYLLSIDSTYCSAGSNLPGYISPTEIDDIVSNWVVDKIPTDKFLIIASHYPMISFKRPQYYVEDPDWISNHYWSDAYALVERVIEHRNEEHTLWLFGDGHIPDFMSENSLHHFLMTGMVGGNFIDVNYEKKDEVKVIEFAGEKPMIYTFSFSSKGYTRMPGLGQWQVTSSPIRLNTRTVDNKIIVDSNAQSSSLPIAPESYDTKTEQISKSVEDSIIERIEQHDLYSMGRHATSGDNVSLGWIAINELFDNQSILTQCIDKSSDWVKGKLPNFKSANALLIGVDLWGAILASQISIRLETRNFSVISRSRGKHNNHHENIVHLCNTLKKEKNIEVIILVTDVISTGSSIVGIQQDIKTELGQSADVLWIAISVISDAKQSRISSMNNFDFIGTFCSSIRIPILNNDALPSEDILPTKFDLR